MADPRSRSSADWQRQEALIRGFEEAWRRGDLPALEAYLPVDAPGPVLLEMVHADLECRFKAGTPARLESYLERFPQLGADPAALAGLVRAEYDLRRRTEPALELREYLPRFPQCAAELNQDVPTCASPAADLPQVPGYEVTRFLARGGMGAVYEARQPRLERRVAVKIMAAEAAQQPAFTDRFVREAQALARLNHPHIVAVHDFGEFDGHYYLAMEFVEGGNLRQRLRAGKLEVAAALALAGQICAALEYAHEEGVVHRDIKPENILLDRRGRAKVADFGLAKLLPGPGTRALTLTGPEQVLGTLPYMAPEQFAAPQTVDARADIYALGVLLHEMLTGELPVGLSDTLRLAGPARLEAAVRRMLQKDPEQRYPSVRDVRLELEALAAAYAPPSATAPGATGLTARYFLTAGGLFLLGWLATGALMNGGWLGLAAAGVLMTGLAGVAAQQALRRLPELRRAIARQGPVLRRTNMSVAGLLFLLGFAALSAAHYAFWDRFSLDPQSLAAWYRGAEQRLLERLPSMRARGVPQVELTTQHAYVADDGPLAIWLALSGCLLVFGAFVVWFETAPCRFTWQGHWLPVLVVGLAALVSLPAAQAVARLRGERSEPVDSRLLHFDAELGKVSLRHYALQADARSVLNALTAWAQEQGYELRIAGMWTLEELPGRRVVGQFWWIEARPSSAFDRWQMTWGGPRRLRPLLKIQCLGSTDSPETAVRIDPGAVPDGAQTPSLWLPVLDSLEAALHGARGYSDDSHPSRKSSEPEYFTSSEKARPVPLAFGHFQR